jgi:hypothetical protein
VPTRGALRGRHGRWVRDAMDAAASGARRRAGRVTPTCTAKSCGPDTPTLVSSLVEQSARRRWQKSPVTGESTKEAVKPLRGESRVELGVPSVTTLVCFLLCTRGCGCSEHRAFPAPLFPWANACQQLGCTSHRGNADLCLRCLKFSHVMRAPVLPSVESAGLTVQGPVVPWFETPRLRPTGYGGLLTMRV